MTFAQNLQNLRQQAGLSQEELTALLGWPTGTIAAYEQELLQPGPAEIAVLAHYFAAAPETLTNTSSANAQELLAVFNTLPSHERQKLLHYAQQLAAPKTPEPDASSAADVLTDAEEAEVRRILSLFGQR